MTAVKKKVVAKKPAKAKAVIAYKGFDQNLRCRDYQFEVGKTYQQEGEIEPCRNGFHACEYPLSIFEYYSPAGNKFALVEQSGVLKQNGDKQCSSHITIKAEIDLPGLIKAAVDFTMSRAKKEKGNHSTGYRGAASSTGVWGAASSTGVGGAASSTGYQGAASSTGNQGAASSTGVGGAASSTGVWGAASSTGKHGVACALGEESRAMAGETGAIIVSWWDDKAARKRYTTGYIGENGIEAGKWYRCDDAGKLVECEA